MQKDTEKLVQNTSWEKEFEKVMGCIPECANGLYEDVGCPAHGYDAMKAVKFFRGVLSQREKEIAEEVEKMKKLPYEPSYCQSRNGIYYCGTCEQTWEMCSCSARNTGHKRAIDDVIRILKHQ